MQKYTPNYNTFTSCVLLPSLLTELVSTRLSWCISMNLCWKYIYHIGGNLGRDISLVGCTDTAKLTSVNKFVTNYTFTCDDKTAKSTSVNSDLFCCRRQSFNSSQTVNRQENDCAIYNLCFTLYEFIEYATINTFCANYQECSG